MHVYLQACVQGPGQSLHHIAMKLQIACKQLKQPPDYITYTPSDTAFINKYLSDMSINI